MNSCYRETSGNRAPSQRDGCQWQDRWHLSSLSIATLLLVQVVAATESLSAALAAIAQLAAHESTSSLQLLADQRTKLMGLAEVRKRLSFPWKSR